MLEASARDIAAAEAAELRIDLAQRPIEELVQAREVNIGHRVSQIVDDVGRVVMTTDACGRPPDGRPRDRGRAGYESSPSSALPGLEERGFVVAVADAPSSNGRRYTVLVAVATRVDTTALRPHHGVRADRRRRPRSRCSAR